MNWMAGATGAIVGAALMAMPACIYGQRVERDIAAIETGKNALERIQKLERNNAEYENLSARDRCLVFMLDSGLPDSACD
ncbi:hypothetical protein [Rhizobium sp. PL01]|uniref:hypothetical protein n=1 Tax=Rhizobium sp. PL01 TaxID=3085631 RepID=UPI0029821E10|nr:hypothetical protein [Rhizobium sp. PL01]MDW5313718.1 hypothetical protein [Rhizobium sp. PL01]